MTKTQWTSMGSLLRGTTADAYGDPADNTTVAASGFPISVMEKTLGTRGGAGIETPDSTTPRVVRTLVGRIPARVAVLTGDRLRDDRNGRIYMIDASTQVESSVTPNDWRLELRRVS
jgi:hypothetical protein